MLEPGRRDTVFGLGVALYNDCRREEAVKYVRDLIATEPDNLCYYFSYLGASLQLNGWRHAAVAAWAVQMEMQARLAEEAGIPKTTRYLPGSFTQTIGHIALIDSWAKRQLLGLSPAERYMIVAPAGRVANSAYLDCWKKYFDVVTGEEAALKKQSHLLDDDITVMAVNGRWLGFHDAACELEERWEASGRGALLHLSDYYIGRGKIAMEAMGLPRDAWFVVCHVRDGSLDAEYEILNSRRSADVADYLPAIRRVTDAGGWVVCLEDFSAPRIPLMPQVIDYAHSERKDWLEHISALSSKVFNRNKLWASVGRRYVRQFRRCIRIQRRWAFKVISATPSPCRSCFGQTPKGGGLTFAEQMVEPSAWTDLLRVLGQIGCTPIKNTPEEISAGVDEMLARANDTWHVDADDAERQRRFMDALRKAGISSRSRIGSQFLKDHSELLG